MRTQDYLKYNIWYCKRHMKNIEQKIINSKKELDFWTAKRLRQVLEKTELRLEDLKCGQLKIKIGKLKNT